MVLEREFNNLLARGTDRRLDEVREAPSDPNIDASPFLHFSLLLTVL